MAVGHQVPSAQRDALKDEFASIPPAAPEPTHSERARTLLHATKSGSLATISVDFPGYPFGSVVSYALDETGRPLLLLSDLAEHTRNLQADSRASLMATEDDRPGDVLALGRVTLIGDLSPVPEEDRPVVRSTYLGAHPNALYVDFGDFNFYRLDVSSVRYVGGFGHMSWVEADEYSAAEPDPLRSEQTAILEHMNNDHGDSLVVYAKAFGGVPEAIGATMLTCDRYGFDLLIEAPAGKHAVRVPFGTATDTPDAVRKAMIRLVTEGRERLG
ncbi:MAG TPA: DUF2470 domain-containing protein [Acidimicrobiales bacterium]|nr:DUF2470 domain-containing protein [Acidimicrobiales bacterium]